MDDREKIVADLRARYGADLPVLDRLPSHAELASERSHIEFIAGALGFQRGMLKTWRGRIVAVIVIPATFSGFLSFWGPKLEVAYEFASPYIQSIAATSAHLTDNLIAFGDLPDPSSPLRSGDSTIVASLVPEFQSLNQPKLSGNHSTATLTLWRISRKLYPALSSARIGGRWTSSGHNVVYTADSPLGAIEEVAFYLRRFATQVGGPISTSDYLLHRISATGAVHVSDIELPNEKTDVDWSRSRRIGDQWLAESRSPIFAYPSSFASNGFNYVLNMDHKDLLTRVEDSFRINPLAELSI